MSRFILASVIFISGFCNAGDLVRIDGEKLSQEEQDRIKTECRFEQRKSAFTNPESTETENEEELAQMAAKQAMSNADNVVALIKCLQSHGVRENFRSKVVVEGHDS